MRNPSEVQRKSIERILSELELAKLNVTENFVGLVEGSPTEDIFWLIRVEEGFKVHVYENGEAGIKGPIRKRIFEKPDFESESEMADAIVEEVASQMRFNGKPGPLFLKLNAKRNKTQAYVFAIVVTIFLLILTWRYLK